MKALRRPATLTEATVEHIGEAIIAGEFAGGSQLAEVPLAKRLDTSRGTVRAALRELEDMGLVEISPHRGAFVSRLTPERASEIISLRVLLESYAAELVGGRDVDRELISDMEELLNRQRDAAATGDLMGLVRYDMDFHHRLASACGHELLVEQIVSLQPQSRRFIVHVRQFGADLDDVVDSHMPILDALYSPTPSGVRTAVETHITQSGKRLLALMRDGALP